MYNRFFGFKERPFKLVPNPAYVYLSRIHEEVLAHLNYAVNFGDGFVAITGEVGTGKTTLCRMFLESLDENTEVAYIFNPKLDSLQLLKAINDEFYIASDTDSVKNLIDNFNTFLLKKKAQGRRVLLLIDEAQNLSVDVLEQLRLLSNLETTTSKLLQIVLVGQPELGALLATEKLRQLEQRITLSCHLVPLGAEETQEYIRHRLHIASTKPGVSFSPAACRSVFKDSGGVPRLINILCDRALLIAFSLGKKHIGKNIVKRAITELKAKHNRQVSRHGWQKAVWGVTLVAVVLAVALVTILVQSRRTAESVKPMIRPDSNIATIEPTQPLISTPPGLEDPPPHAVESAASPSSPPPSNAVPQAVAVNDTAVSDLPVEPTGVDLRQTIAAMADPLRSRDGALEAVLKAWDVPAGQTIPFTDNLDAEAFFRVTARRSDFETLHVKGDLNVIKKLNLPAILEFNRPGTGEYCYLAVLVLTDETIQLSDGDRLFSMPPASLAGLWNGMAYVLWKNFYHFEGVIPTSSPREAILSLKMYVKTLGFPISEITAVYDITTRAAVETIQARNGLEPDGMVGPLTKIILYNEDPGLDIPHLLPVPTGDDRIEPGNAGKRQTAGHFISRGETISDLNEENRP